MDVADNNNREMVELNSPPEIFEPVPLTDNGRPVSSAETSVTPAVPEERREFNFEEFYMRMKSESERLRTFITGKWPVPYISPEELATWGFFYLLNRDRVQCAFCRGVICGWEPGDKPYNEHLRHFPRCEFLMQYNVGNIPSTEDPMRGPKRPPGNDVCGNHTFPTTVENAKNSRCKVYSNPLPSPLRQLGVSLHHGPKNPQYVSVDSRLRSFSNYWPPNSPIKPKQLIEAGFFSIGMDDYVKCYYCDGGLCNWEKGDEPWTEHARWFPDCEFVRLSKGDSFIESCKLKTEAHEIEKAGQSMSEETLALKVVNEWLSSDVVLELRQIHSFPVELIKTVLHRRWTQKQQPFSTFDELYQAINQHNAGIEDSGVESGSGSGNSSDSEETPKSIPESTSSTSSSPCNSLNMDKEENRLLCKICLDKEVGVVFLPCGHSVACPQCAAGVSACPICRQKILGTVRTFFS